MKIPRWNRLTGLLWWRRLSELDSSESFRIASEEKISTLLRSPLPCAIGKIGTTELLGLEYLFRYFQPPWPHAASWRRPAQRLHDCSGIYPVRHDIYLDWADECRRALGQMDLLSQWQVPSTYLAAFEGRVLALLAPQAFRAHRNFIHFLHPPESWLGDLAALRWLVVHPFEKTIRAQLPHLASLGVYPAHALPDLERRTCDTSILACPQFSYMVPPKHANWSAALAEMKKEMEHYDFDIALIGAGAWSLPLAAHAKRIGRKALHLGGATQLLFGIRGGRFDQWGFGYHQQWVRPLPEETPKNCRLMEEGAYW